MTIREYKRICKQAGCGEEFIVSAPSIEEDRAIGFSEPEYCPKHRALHARSYSRIACHHFEIELTASGEALVRQIEQHKIEETSQSIDTVGRRFDPWTMPDAGLGPGGLGRFTRPLRGFIENTEYQPQPKIFQIAEKKDEILAALEDHQVVVLVGTTGSGKSTYVPWLLLTGGEPGKLSKWARRGPICVTQPRIQATRQVPKFIANALNGTSLGVGSQIGFSHSNADEFDRRTRLIFKTDGKLLNDIVSGAVSNYSIIIIDEAHERSVNIDLILGLLKDQLYLYPHLRVIIASATIDFGAFLGFFYSELKDELAPFEDETFRRTYSYFKTGRRIPFIYSEGRRFPIVEHWWGAPNQDEGELIPDWWKQISPSQRPALEPIPDWWKQINNGQQPTRDQLPDAIADQVQLLCLYLDKLPPHRKEVEDGHILVFLPGTREIDQTVATIKAYDLPNVAALPLYAQRPLDEQDAALNPDRKRHPNVYGKRRVVVSTNVAETSLTVEGVKYVIDTGYIKESYWNPSTEVLELQTVRHSQSGCRQRWGRAGRISSGHTYMLYTQKQFEDPLVFPKDSSPAIARSSLEQVLLTAKAAGVRSAKARTTVTAPSAAANDAVLDFQWMPLSSDKDAERQRKELKRAYITLQRQKAIDTDGDLTRFGLELRGMPAALDVVRIFTEGELHAMGVEVATLLPFLKLDYGLQTILLWKREWDSYTKLAIRQNHLDLVYGCRDDLELYLKIWILWERRSEKQQRAWEEEGGINYKEFHERIELERRKILETAMDWRKAEKRTIAVEKIDALRALIAHCVHNEIYIPVESVETSSASDVVGPDRRFRSSDVLDWESYWEGMDVYEEYDDEVDFNSINKPATSERSGVYRRYSQPAGDADESALIELAPTSICFGKADADLLVACQRRANFRRPARAKVLGMNMIRMQRDWLSAIEGSVVDRSLLYASLSRHRDPGDHHRLNVRLFLPWLIRRGSSVTATVRSVTDEHNVELDLHTRLPNDVPVPSLSSQELSVSGRLALDGSENREQVTLDEGAEIEVQVIGYSLSENGDPLVLVQRPKISQRAFRDFAKRYRDGAVIEVEMRRVLDDPLGRSPMFIVREPVSGLEIPMSDCDFCGNTHPQAYYGRRFEVGERFEVDVESIDRKEEQVFLSRGRLLLKEYAQVADPDYKIIEVVVKRVDTDGVYLTIPGSAYIGFVRRALWYPGFTPEPSGRVKARLRRFDRHVNVQKMEQRLKDHEPLPEELDLGIELDLRVPWAYRIFTEHKKRRIGDIITVTVERPLDSGGLLIALEEGLKGMLYESELGLDEQGNLRSARTYTPGEIIPVRIYQMFDDSATVRCSIFRRIPIPDGLAQGQVVDSRVLLVREDSRNETKLRLTCSWQDTYQIQAQALASDFDPPLEVDERVLVRIDRINERVSLIQGTCEQRSEN